MADKESDIKSRLHAIAGLLHQTGRMGEITRQELAHLLDELAEALHAEDLSADQRTHLAESTQHLLEAVQQQGEAGVLAAARNRLQKAVVAVEADAPVAAGLIRRVMDALGNLGI